MRSFIASLLKTDKPTEVASPAPHWVEISAGPLAGGRLYLDTDATPDWEREMAAGCFDDFIYQELNKCSPHVLTTFWDVGAHIGYHSLCVANLMKDEGRVISFEPNACNVERFRLHLERNECLARRITLMTTALSNVNGEASFKFSSVIDDGTSSGSYLASAIPPGPSSEYAKFEETRVRTTRADALLGELPAPTLMKIDVEGAEQLVLEGASEILTRVRPLLFVEIHSITQMFYVQKILLDAGYTLKVLDAEHASLSRCFIVAKS